MGLPRTFYVKEGQEGVYHCFSRCVRRAFLYGFDPLTLRDFSHRKAWLVERLRHLAAIFAIEVCAYVILANHFHTILRTRPDIVAAWSDLEVATRWLMLSPRHRDRRGVPIPPAEKEIRALADCTDRIAQLRKRLCSLSWFMGRLNEFIARAANKEDAVKGRFWESRFKCQVLLDEAAIVAGMVYVDLNPIRAGLAATPEESDFTSIQERIRAWQRKTMRTSSDPRGTQSVPEVGTSLPDDTLEIPEVLSRGLSDLPDSSDNAALTASWLCPIQSDSGWRGILPMTAEEYFHLVDTSGRMLRSGKRGAIDADLVPILLRLGANPEAWSDTISRFGTEFGLAAGLLSNLRRFAERLGRRWLKGVTSARAAFASSAPQLA